MIAGAMRPTRDAMRPEETVPGRVDTVGGLATATGNVVPVPSKQISPEEDMFCQCDPMEDASENRKFTHLECKNPDGTTYLQILDSDSEVAEEGV